MHQEGRLAPMPVESQLVMLDRVTVVVVVVGDKVTGNGRQVGGLGQVGRSRGGLLLEDCNGRAVVRAPGGVEDSTHSLVVLVVVESWGGVDEVR